MNVSILFWLVGGLLLLSFLIDLLSLSGLVWEIPSASRAIYSKVCGYIVVETPEDIRVASANGLIKPGDVLMANHHQQMTDGEPSLFSIHPSIVGRPAGTELLVVSIRPALLVLHEMPTTGRVATGRATDG